MKLEHSFTVPASIDETWEAFNDLERVVPCFPGATLSTFEDDEFTGSAKVKLGPISLQYKGSGQFLERDEAKHRAVLEAKGKDRRGNGTASVTVTAQLTSEGATSTSVVVETDMTVTGKPAQFGRGVMQDVSDKMLGQFIDCLTTKLGPAAAEPAEPSDLEAATSAAGAGPVPQPVTEPGPSEGHSARQSAQPAPEVALDLGKTVLPVLAKRYGAYVAAAVIVLLVLRRLLR